MSTKLISVMNYIQELYGTRMIMFALIRKNIIGRYKYSYFGFLWHFFTPIMLLLVYYVIFTSGVRASPIDDFFVYLSSGLFLFTFLTSNLTGGCSCITVNASMVKKIYFPREIIVLSHVISSFIIMIIGYVVVLAIIIAMGFGVSALDLIGLLLVLGLSFLFALGFVFLFSALNVYKRDVQYFLASISTLFLFMTPMYFSVQSVSGTLSWAIWLNPFTYFVEAAHCFVYYHELPALDLLVGCVFLTVFSLGVGLTVFVKLKRGFVERL